MSTTVRLDYFTDILCIWAYLATVKIEEINRQFGDGCTIHHRYTTLFGNTHQKLTVGWKDRGGMAAYADHVQQVAQKFNVTVHNDAWHNAVPQSSLSIHTTIMAAELSQAGAPIPSDQCGLTTCSSVANAFRQAFFIDGLNIGGQSVQEDLLSALSIDVDQTRRHLQSGAAHARLNTDINDAANFSVTGSPTYVLNDGRQKLYGNVGYKIIEANIRELSERPADIASWC